MHIYAVLARSTFPPSQNAQNTPGEKVYVVVARSTFRSQNAKNTTCSGPFYVQMWFRVAGASTLDRWNGKIASALHSTFHF